jgi:hypothetical protein
MVEAVATWSDTTLANYRNKEVPTNRNWGNTITDFIKGDGTNARAIFAAIIPMVIAAWLTPDEYQKSVPAATFVLSLCLIVVIYKMAKRRAIVAPVWTIHSITDFLDIWDYKIPVSHPLRSTIREIRREQKDPEPEAEFKIEYLDEPERDAFPRHIILWMNKSPFTEASRSIVLVLRDWNFVVSAPNP